MEEFLFQEKPLEERIDILSANCDQIEERNYTRKFNQDEMNERKSELASVSIQINEIEQEFKEVKAEFGGKLKPLGERIQRIIEELKSGGEYVKAKCYKMVDLDEGMTGWYSPEGVLLESRKAKPEERQRTAFQTLRRTGTDDQ
ncbi:MAG TPA: hypothetical protein DDW85_02260 [Porphyromonadaceae bacterium]|nr:hypothetical protein [Porphyromonadaceae bacterium]